eukprot:356979-Chlamydomonas_euryale.AAC.9
MTATRCNSQFTHRVDMTGDPVISGVGVWTPLPRNAPVRISLTAIPTPTNLHWVAATPRRVVTFRVNEAAGPV